jgi:hypothetical protein
MLNAMDNTDVNTYYPVMDDISEPLISNTAHQAVPFTMRYLYFLSFLTGSYMAAGSQLLLSTMMQYTHPKNSCQIACLWLACFVLISLVVCLGMTAWIRLVQRGRSVQDEALSLKLQAFYIDGSLAGLSLGIQIASFVKSVPPVAALLAVVAMVIWFSVMILLTPNTNHSCHGTSTYQLVGAKIGLLTGLTQLVLCISLYGWMDTVASAIWLGMATFIWTAAGWAGMHLIDQDCEHCEHMESSYSRVESAYLAFICLAWIDMMCLAWIAVDWLYNGRETIPIQVLVTLSLPIVFMAAVHLPDDTCLELEQKESFV